MESCSSSVATDQTDRCSNFSVISSLSQVGLTLHLQFQFHLFSAARAVNNERDGGGLVGELEKRWIRIAWVAWSKGGKQDNEKRKQDEAKVACEDRTGEPHCLPPFYYFLNNRRAWSWKSEINWRGASKRQLGKGRQLLSWRGGNSSWPGKKTTEEHM